MLGERGMDDRKNKDVARQLLIDEQVTVLRNESCQ